MNRRSDKRILGGDPLWFKNAIIYEVHVKAYYDSNGDGIGDFPGLTQKLDYIQNLGVNTIWLLPFFSSPLRDDGYDIANYLDIHPTYGTLADFRRFLREAHSRNIRVIIELVVNHTSDAHPWFQAARRAPKGSNRRNFYVWNDDDDKYKDARIIFTDSETSNWSWDPVAKSYYWHRFFSHQPDLNFNNPQVVKKLVSVMKFWLDLGVDGLRLDAVPYLCERDGTNCENLPETHEIIKTFRREMDTHYQDRIFLAEANQWPEDAAEYFGSGDECHMAFHFPLMPRIYMALALEERFPIVEILKQTPDIPPNCQWAVFLRNHDELTLEMVTNKERDYMYEAYANEPRARINVGIRRRLAPLMEYSRAKIELMNALLLSICGSPVIYYGDEIGMGDNLFLGDRNGVRTPMQWTPDRNGGFSAADPERLFLPPVMEAITGFQAVNVEAQKRNPSSLLNWMKRLISVRKQFKAFGEGTLEFIKPANRNILAFVRNHADGNILCVANLSRSAQPVHLDLQKFKGYTPVEMLGKNQFPTISDEPYQLSLAAYGFYWFELSITATGPAWQSFDELTHYELPVLVFRAQAGDKQLAGLQKLLADKRREKLLLEAITQYFTRKRWFAGKNRQFSHISLDPVGVVASKD
ncbi:MAG: maltose alpha-D-glucosyltransferase, partial [Candidatus Riflebacteria bacterium]|nr:maltose alpha-D-glucosyltransferase [Candidatus Riflebacteria bacterium]